MDRLFKKIDKIAIFFIVYTVIFIGFFKTLTYTLPFVLALIFSLILMKPTKVLVNKFKVKRSIASLITTIAFFIIITLLLLWSAAHLIQETTQLAKNIQLYLSNNSNLFPNFYKKIYTYYSNLDPSIINAIEKNLSSTITKVSNATISVTSAILGGIISFFSSIPYIFMVIFFTLISTYYFTKDITGFKEKVFSYIPSEKNDKIYNTVNETKKMLTHYFLSYLIIVLISFLVTLVGFLVLGVKYAVLLSFLSAIFDILPILGMGTIYVPLAIIYFFSKNYFVAAGILILFILASTVRQIVEPKIVSTSLGVHPVAILAALFIGLMANGVSGMIFCVFLVIFYNVLNRADIL